MGKWGQTDRSSFIVLEQRYNGTILPWDGTGCDRLGQARTACQNMGRDAGPGAWDAGRNAGRDPGGDNHYFFPENGISVKYFCPGIKGQRDVKRETLVYMQSFSIFL